ncbi:MAG TPA: amidohydrolase family protein [Candidatus Saccharimonadales bacterium]
MGKIITLPGLIDPHVHLRDPWQLQKEDFLSGTSAALAGGYVAVMDMPNNQEHIVSQVLLDKKITSARSKIVCDIGFHFSALSSDTVGEFAKVKDKAIGLKLFITTTTNMDRQRGLNNIDELEAVFKAWFEDKPILLHAEDETVKLGIEAVRRTGRRTHFCHISSEEELTPILRAKDEGLPVSCGATPHHLFLSAADLERLGPYGLVKPNLKPKRDQRFLWDHLDAIDIVESDHAPHTRAEKESANPPFGVPGLETTVPLMLTAEAEGKLTRAQLIEKLHANPARLLGLVPDEATHIEVDMAGREIKNEELFTKAGWSPFAGRRVVGKVIRVVLRGEKVYDNGRVLAQPGSGRILS